MKESELITEANLNIESISSSIVVDFLRIPGGGNNRLYKATTENREEFLVKEYFLDDRKRLQREYGALDFLHGSGFLDVPVPYFADEVGYYAIYSFEKGKTSDAKSFTRNEVDNVVLFLNRLQSIKPDNLIKTKFSDALFASRSLDEYSETVLFKFGNFEESLGLKEINPKVIQLAETYKLDEIVRGRIGKLRNNLGTRKLFNPIKDSEMRLSPVDFGPHNMIVRNDGQICFIDFEYFGWDDPVKIIVNFMHHEGSRDIPHEQKLYFLDKFKEQSMLSPHIIKRIDVAAPLAALDWISILLWGITPDRVSSKKFLDPNINIENYLDKQISKIVVRIDELQKIDKIT